VNLQDHPLPTVAYDPAVHTHLLPARHGDDMVWVVVDRVAPWHLGRNPPCWYNPVTHQRGPATVVIGYPPQEGTP